MTRGKSERVAGALLLLACGVWTARGQAMRKGGVRGEAGLTGLRAPILIYEGWASDGEAAASKSIDEKQALTELGEVVRLKRSGVRINYDVLDGAWFVAGEQGQRMEGWPNGLARWIRRCRAHDIGPGLWFGADTLKKMQEAQTKRSPAAEGRAGMRLTAAAPARRLTSNLQTLYNSGIRLFAFDFVEKTSAAPQNRMEPGGRVAERPDVEAIQKQLGAFRRRNPGAVVFIEEESPAVNLASGVAASHTGNLRRVGGFAVVTAGGPRPSRVPEQDFWRSVDIEGDAWVRREKLDGVPPERMEADFAVAASKSGNARGMHGWKGAFLLALARGEWVVAVRGNLAVIGGKDARWMARAQRLFRSLGAREGMFSFGGDPSTGKPYGYAGATARGSVAVAVNPSQTVATLALPLRACQRAAWGAGRVQFLDAGFQVRVMGNKLTLGPGQMAVVGYGAFSGRSYNLGVQQDVTIPTYIAPVPADFYEVEPGMIAVRLDPPIHGVLRVVVRRSGPEGNSGPAPAEEASTRQTAGPQFTIDAMQSGRPIPIRVDEDALAWKGVSWAVGEMDVNDLTPGLPLNVYIHCSLRDAGKLVGRAYRVEY